jgi:hypothetical protein
MTRDDWRALIRERSGGSERSTDRSRSDLALSGDRIVVVVGLAQAQIPIARMADAEPEMARWILRGIEDQLFRADATIESLVQASWVRKDGIAHLPSEEAS